MAARKMNTEITRSTYNLIVDAKEQPAHSQKSSSKIKAQTTEALIRELQIHQIELEIQTDELRKAQLALAQLTLEGSRDNYHDRYAFAQIGYLTLTDTALIADVNLSGAMLLGAVRNDIINNGFRQFIAPADLENWDQYFANVQRDVKKQVCILTLKRGDDFTFSARLEGSRITASDGTIAVRIAISDIPDIRQAEETLRKSDEKRTLIETINEGIWVIDREAVTTFVNPKMAKILGYSVGDMTGRSLFSFMDDKGRHIFERNIEQRQLGIKEQHNFEFLKKDGTRIYASIEVAPVKGKDGEYLGAFAGVIDITERIRAEMAVKENEERNRSIVKALPGLIFHFSADGRFIDCQFNKGDLLLLQPDQIIGKQVAEILPPDLAHLTERKIKETLDSGQLQTFEYSLPVGEQERFFKARMITNGNNSVLAFVHDITERKRAAEAIQESERKYRNIFENSVVGLFQTTPDDRLINGNDALAQIYGFSDAAELLASDSDVGNLPYANEKDRREVLHILAEKGKVENYETLHIKRDGKHFWVSITAWIIQDTEGNVLLHEGTIIDITQRKRAEERLVAALKRTRDQRAALGEISCNPYLFSGDVHGLSASLTEVSSGVLGVERASVWLFDDNGDELRCIDLYETSQDRHSRNLLLKRHEYINQFNALSTAKFIDAHDPLTDPRTAGYVEGYIKPNRITSMLDAVIRVSGQNIGFICFEHVDRPHRWESDEIAFACQLADQIAITLVNHDRNQAEEALQESEDKYRGIFFKSVTGLFKITPDGSLIDVNDAFAHVYDYSGAAEMLADSRAGRHLYISRYLYANPEDRDKIHRILAEKGKIENYETQHIKRDGSHIWVSINARSIRDANGTVLFFEGTIINITERKRMEDALRKSEEKYRHLIENSHDIIYTMTPKGVFTFVSPGWTVLLGHPVTEIVGKPFQQFVHPDDLAGYRTFMQKIIDTGQRQTDFEYRVQHVNGSWLWNTTNAVPIRDESGTIVAIEGSTSDITERKRAEDALREANKKLTLLSGITRHDINNQLTALWGYLALLENKQPDSAQNEYFEKVSTAAQKISSMIRFTKEYESIGVKAPTWQYGRTLVDTAVKDTLLRKVMLKNDLPAGIEVFADPLIVKVFYNLMDNAVRYGGKITTIRFSVQESGDDHIIVCEDDGNGIVAEEKGRIFERGFGKNTGLGLALSRDILDITGITIRETGEPGKGARFEITVPKGAWRFTGVCSKTIAG